MHHEDDEDDPWALGAASNSSISSPQDFGHSSLSQTLLAKKNENQETKTECDLSPHITSETSNDPWAATQSKSNTLSLRKPSSTQYPTTHPMNKTEVVTTSSNVLRRRQGSANNITEDSETRHDESLIAQELTLVDQVLLLGIKERGGYVSMLNDTISYVLRACIILELAFRGRLQLIYTVPRRKHPRGVLQVKIDENSRGIEAEPLLQECEHIIQVESHGIQGWLDILAGESWNPMKGWMQLKQVRERVAKGLVDKGVLSTSKSSVLAIFEFASHPLSDPQTKAQLIDHLSRAAIDGDASDLKIVCLLVASYIGGVLGPALSSRTANSTSLTPKDKETVIRRAQQWLREYSIVDLRQIGEDRRESGRRHGGDSLHLRQIIASTFEVFAMLEFQ